MKLENCLKNIFTHLSFIVVFCLLTSSCCNFSNWTEKTWGGPYLLDDKVERNTSNDIYRNTHYRNTWDGRSVSFAEGTANE